MDKITISVQEIKNNPNLNLTGKILKLKEDYGRNYNDEELKDFAIALIKQEYEFYANSRINKSPEADAILEKIKNGDEITQKEGFILNCDNLETIEKYSKYYDLKDRIKNNNGISLDDLNFLFNNIGIDEQLRKQIQDGFERKGLIVDYNDQRDEKHYR